MKDVLELVIITDKSGSMYGLEKDVVGGFNQLIESTKKEGQAQVTTILFDNEVKFVHEQADIKEVKPLTENDYQPSGCTALLDAIGNAIMFIKHKHALLKEEELPKKTFVSIMTDGLENASREYSYSQIHNMIDMQKKCGWDFYFQAANIDVDYEADRLGIDKDMRVAFKASKSGVKHQSEVLCCMVSDAMVSKTKNKKTKNKIVCCCALANCYVNFTSLLVYSIGKRTFSKQGDVVCIVILITRK